MSAKIENFGSGIKLIGTIDNMTFYKMNRVYYVRKKSSLSGKKVKKHPHFENTRRNGRWFGQSSTIASLVYRCFARDERDKKVFYAMKNRALMLIRQGKEQEEIIRLVKEEFLSPAQNKKRK